ncbi:hypothetical protein [Plantactinospora sp. GCM10030261]|uniref:hypothetical protein n=1 Tax=Plantactinospora sp. GCM10030261 TaxID=3273420 RepID=UPI003612D25A
MTRDDDAWTRWTDGAVEPPEPRRGPANWILAGLIVAFGVVVFVAAVRTGRADSALLFVGLPALLAAALALTPGRTTHGRVFSFTTVFLLVAAVALHEGAICVVLAAPIVYAVAHGVTALIRWTVGSSRYPLLVLPLLLASGLEGVTDELRVDPVQSVGVTRTVSLPANEVVTRLADGPRPVPTRSPALRALNVPLPDRVTGDGLDPGDRWMFGYHGSAHGPGGHIVTEVTEREPGRVAFRFVEDSSIVGRWIEWRQAELRWHDAGAGRAEVRLTISYERGLDPSWYFGPAQDAFLHQGAAHLLDMLTLR